MERNSKLYEAAKLLMTTSKIIKFEAPDLFEQILDIAELALQRIVVDEKEIGEIEKYEQKLRN
jgi:hypothetical protein